MIQFKNKNKPADTNIDTKNAFDDRPGGGYSIAGTVVLVLKRRKWHLIIMTVLVMLASALLFYTRSLNDASATMMLNYEESSKRLAPNGTRFNIGEITSEDVLEDAIKDAGLEGRISAQELSENISVLEMFNKSPSDEGNYYIPTSYRISFEKPDGISGISAGDLLEIICTSYLDYFDTRYTMNPAVLEEDYSKIDGMEYNEIGSFFSMRLNEMSRYLNMRSSQGGQFRAESTGETFNSLEKLVSNLKDYALEDYNAYIWENGIVKDRYRYMDTLSYLNDTNSRTRLEMFNEYLIRRDVISYYSVPMSTSILIPTRNGEDYYMARTKTGVDYLALEAQFYLETAKGLDLTVARNTDKYEKINPNTSDWQKNKADQMVEDIKNELIRIEELAMSTDKEYAYENSRNYITFRFDSRGIIDRLPKKEIIFIGAVFFAAALFVFYKEQKGFLKGKRAPKLT